MAYTSDDYVRLNASGIGTGVVGTTSMGTFIEMADSDINSELSIRYKVPFTSVPPIVKRISTDLTTYYALRSVFSDESENVTSWIAEFKSNALNELEKIREGKKDLTDSSGNIISQQKASTTSVISNTMSYTPTFLVDDEKSWAVDADLLEEIADERD